MIDRPRTRSTGLAGVTNLAVMAPVRQGMVPGYEPISYLERLRKVLAVLHESRRNLRESELMSVFPDAIGRFRFIHTFRYALVEPATAAPDASVEPGPWHLSLNVTFDGGWEPYMRVIHRDLGPFLDLLFCHCPTYPGSSASFDKYCDWVRANEVSGGLFFADSPLTVDDSHYLADVEGLQRDGQGDAAMARRRLAPSKQQADDALRKALADPERALAVPLRTLKGLYRLTTLFQPYADGPVLHRFAKDVLKDPIALMNQIEAASKNVPADSPQGMLGQKWAALKGKLLREELAWLEWDKREEKPQRPRNVIGTTEVQAHVLNTTERMTHGCLVLLQVKDVAKAQAKVVALAPRCGLVSEGDIGYMVGFTCAGLSALGVTADRLATLPQEFLEGMEARAALLGDLRSNHPDRWVRPLLWQQEASGQRADLRAVHLLVQVRLKDPDSQHELHPLLLAEVAGLGAEGTGLRVLAVEPMRSYRDAQGRNVVGHMGVADGLSQPELPTAPAKPFTFQDDQVAPGELLLGQANDRGDVKPPMNDLLDHGTFLAVRKLRQFMDRLDAVAPLSSTPGRALLEKMVGRGIDGQPLHGLPLDARHDNDFDFSTPAASDACPFHSHVRRTNPRDGRPYIPRILRRGMSWGLNSDTDRHTPRGVMFMAYCASLAEQFEVIQRWVAGANAGGVGSAQGDPLLRVPVEGERYTFRYMDANGAVQRVVMPEQPLVQLQWGLYAFVPSLAVLRGFVALTQPAVATTLLKETPENKPPSSPLEATRALLEDRERSKLAWQAVRAAQQPGQKAGTPSALMDGDYGRLVGRLVEVRAALEDQGQKYSVAGYAERMRDTIGLNLLGMDPGPERDALLGVNDAIAAIDGQTAFDKALPIAGKFLAQLQPIPSAPGDLVVRRPLDLVDFSTFVIAELCKTWFGLPDGTSLVMGGPQPGPPTRARCPGSLGPASRYMFMPHPHADFQPDGRAHAKAVRDAVGEWLATSPDLTPHQLSNDIRAALPKTSTQADLADNIAGTLLGFAPSVQSNFLRAMQTWLDDGQTLWLCQQGLFEQSPGKDTLTFAEADAALRRPLLDAMRKFPVPTMVWRCPVVDGKPDTSRRVVLGLESALAEGGEDGNYDELLFGRYHDVTGKNTTVHGCPGYRIAIGVMLALIASLMKAGTLRPTGSPVLLILTQP